MKQHTISAAIALALLASSAVHAQDAVQWKVANGGNGHWYRIDSIGADADYQSKVDYAHSRGATLTSISDSKENQFVSMAAQTSGVTGRLVIGGRRSCVSCNWNWIDGSVWTYSNWGSGEPGNGGAVHVEMFVGFGQPGSWADVDDSDGSCPQISLKWSADCNADGIVDYGQILTGQLPDANSNGVPDGCETLRVPEDFATIQAAVNAAVNGVTISVAPGSYAPFSFNGKRITVQSTSGATATTIDASGQNVSAVVFGIGASFDTTIRGFTIKTGDAGGGGGVFLNGDGTPAGNCDGTIEDCRFIRGAGNVGYGGGVYAEYGNIVVRRCVFNGLYAEHFHGAMGIAMTDYSSVPGMPGVGALIEDCEFRNCQSWNNGALGIRGIQSTKAVLRRVLFIGNVSPFATGALLTGSPGLDGTPTPAVLQLDIDRCVFTGNEGPFSAGISEGSPYPGQFTPMTINVTGSIFADSGTSIVTQGSTQLRIQGTRFCAGAGAIGSPYTDLGGNGFSCATPTDCDSDGLPDAFAIVLGRVADVDGNGIPDICEGPTCHDIDLNLNGIVDGGALGVLLAFWGPVSPAFPRADINRDGLVNGADLGILLAFWGPCPN